MKTKKRKNKITMLDMFENFNKKRYRRIIKKNKYSFKMSPCPVSIESPSRMLAYEIIVKNYTTKKSLLYYISLFTVCYLSEESFDREILNYIIRQINSGRRK